MDFLAHIQMMRVPVWARIIIYGGFVGIVSVCVFLAWYALRWQAPESWLGAAVALFAAIFPLMVVILIATTVHTGENAIRDHTDRFLVKTIPSILVRIPEEDAAFSAFCPQYRSGQRKRFAKVDVSHRGGDCFADYRISFDDGGRQLVLLIRVELNVRRLNFNLYLPVDPLETAIAGRDGRVAGQLTVEHLRQAIFRHTLDAASNGTPQAEGDHATSGSYVFHHEIFARALEGRKWYVLVGSSPLARDLLWNPAERLFVTQDLMFMLRALASEGMDLFVSH